MPLSTNPFVSAVTDLVVNRAIPGSIRADQRVQAGVYAAGVVRNVLNTRTSELGAGPDSALNGQTAPDNRARARDQIDQAIQSRVNLPSDTEINPITQTGSIPATLISTLTRDSIVSGINTIDEVRDTVAAATDVIQAARTRNLPNIDIVSLLTAEANNFDWGDPATVVRAIPIEPGDWRVRIAAPLQLGEIVFPVLPTMTLSHKANYKEDNLVHTNYQFLSYRSSQPDDIQITCDWPVETPNDALQWLQMILLGRSLTKMFYGASANLGNPPPICTLRGYSGNANGVILPDMPIVVKAFSFDLKDDVGYIEYADNYVPRLSTVTFTCTVIYNRNSQRAFDFVQYRKGDPNTPIRY
jgi:hypothetical protein